MIKALVVTLLIIFSNCRSYPLYSQCDSKWANDKMGTGSKTICQIGCLMSSAAMALSGCGKSYNPGTLNKWLTSNGGYSSGNLFVWSSIGKLGLSFQGFFGNNVLKAKLDAGYIVICNVRGGSHWVLATGYSGDNIKVNDPGYSVSSYPISGIVDGNNGVYKQSGTPEFLRKWYYFIEDFIYETFPIER